MTQQLAQTLKATFHFGMVYDFKNYWGIHGSLDVGLTARGTSHSALGTYKPFFGFGIKNQPKPDEQKSQALDALLLNPSARNAVQQGNFPTWRLNLSISTTSPGLLLEAARWSRRRSRASPPEGFMGLVDFVESHGQNFEGNGHNARSGAKRRCCGSGFAVVLFFGSATGSVGFFENGTGRQVKESRMH